MKSTEISVVLTGVLLLCLTGCFDTAQAQNNTLSANPSQLTFNTQQGVTPPSQTVLVSYSGGAANVTVSSFSANNWLVVTPSSGATPLSLTVSIGAGAPSSGSDVGFINVEGPDSSQLHIEVNLNVNSSGTSPLSASPNSLSFNFPANSTLPASQTVTVSSNNAGVTSYTASTVTNNGGNWLSVLPTSGNLPGSFQATVNPASLGAGTFNGAIAINAPGTTGTTLQVLVTVAGTPALNVSPAQLAFAFQLGQGGPASQNLTLTSSTGSNISFSASTKTTSCGNNWLVISQTQGATPATLTVQINTSGLSAGNCSGEIDFAAPDASNPNVVIPVTLLVSTNPLLQVPSAGPTFNYQIGGSLPAAQNVQITSSSAPLNFTVAAAPVSNGPNFLVVSPASGTTPQAVNLSINASIAAGLGPGTYGETVTITSAGAGNSPQSFPVTLVVSSNPILTATVSSLNFNYQVGQAVPANQTFTVGSTGAPLTFQVATSTTSCSGFLAASPANGSTFGNQNQVVVSIDTTGLTTSQSCSGSVTLNVPGSGSPPLVIPVTLNVSTTPLLNVGQSAIVVTKVVGAASSTVPLVPVTSTDPSTPLQFTATAATNPIGLTWLAVAPNSGNTPSNLQVTINPANLAVGVYSGTITVSSTAPNVPAQTINVTLNIVASNASANPASLTFTQTVGGAAPSSQTVTVDGVPTGATVGVIATMLNGTGWLSASVAANVVTVTANGSQLPQGSYAGTVTVIVPGAGNSPLNIGVTLNVGAAPVLVISENTVNFNIQFGTPVSGSKDILVSSSGGNVPFNATFAATTGGAFVTVAPASGNTPSTVTLTLNAAVVSNLAAGSYSGKLTISSPNVAGGDKIVTVNLTVTPASTPVIQSLSNAASLQPTNSAAPGEIITLKGLNLGPATPAEGIQFTPTNGMVPTTLGGIKVLFNNNVAAPLLYVSAVQINAIVPYEMGSFSSATITIQFGGATSAVFQVQIVPTAPAIFSLSQGGSGQGAILNQDFKVNGADNPAAKNSVVQIFGTGEGQLIPSGVTGCITGAVPPFAVPVAKPVTVTIGGQPAEVTYGGEAPTLVCGAIQVNARIPNSVGSGPQTVVLTIGTTTNAGQSITVQVQ